MRALVGGLVLAQALGVGLLVVVTDHCRRVAGRVRVVVALVSATVGSTVGRRQAADEHRLTDLKRVVVQTDVGDHAAAVFELLTGVAVSVRGVLASRRLLIGRAAAATGLVLGLRLLAPARLVPRLVTATRLVLRRAAAVVRSPLAGGLLLVRGTAV